MRLAIPPPYCNQLPFKLQINLFLHSDYLKMPIMLGRGLAVWLATETFFDETTLGESSLTGDQGKLKILDQESLADIEDIILSIYRGKVKDNKEHFQWGSWDFVWCNRLHIHWSPTDHCTYCWKSFYKCSKNNGWSGCWNGGEGQVTQT